MLTDVTDDMRVLQEETFGPVMTIVRVRDEEEAIRSSNDSNYGLTASVWTRDTRKGVEIGKRIDTGNVDVNDFPQTYGSAEAPFGGRKGQRCGTGERCSWPRGLLPRPTDSDRSIRRQTDGGKVSRCL